MKMMLGAAVAAVVLSLAMPAAAMDIAAVKRKETPAQDSAQAAQVCAAAMSGAAYLAEKDSEDQELYITLAKAWVGMAASFSGKEYNAYLDDPLMADMQALYDAGDDVVVFYQHYCLVETKRIMES